METAKKVLFPNLRAEIARNGDTLEDLSIALDMSIPSVSRRLSAETEWGIGEVDILCKRYNVPYEKLFARE